MLETIIVQHAEEAAFQRLRRDAATRAPHYGLEDLVKLDSTVGAHLDGLRIAGDAGWEIVVDELAWEEPGEMFTAAALAFASGADDRIEQVLAVAEKDVELARGAVSAFGWLDAEQAGPVIQTLLQSDSVARRRIGIAGAAVRGDDPDRWVPGVLATALGEDDLAMRSRALIAIGELGRHDLPTHLNSGLSDDDPGIRFAAAWSGAIVGEGAAGQTLQALADEEGGAYAEPAAMMAARVIPPAQAAAWVRSLADPRIRMKAAGALGDPAIAEDIVALFSDDDHSRVAGEALSMMTGVDLAYDDLERDPPEGFEAGPTESPDDTDVALDDDEDLPFADPALLSAWWSEHAGAYSPGTRYLMGQPMGGAALQDVLVKGYQRQRLAAAVELAIRQPGQPIFNARSRGDWQRAALRVTGPG